MSLQVAQNQAARIARLMRAIRKSRKMTQTELAGSLEVSQSAISKFEAAELTLSASQWYSLCQVAGIDPDLTWKTGLLDRGLEYGLGQEPDLGGFKLPVQYKRNRGSRLRSLLPLIEHARSLWGEKGLEEWTDSHRLDSDFLNIADQSLHLNFVTDLMSELVKRGQLNHNTAQFLGKKFSDPLTHGVTQQFYKGVTHPLSRLLVMAKHMQAYDINFEYLWDGHAGVPPTLETSGIPPQQLELSIKPQEFIKGTGYKSPELGDLLCAYRKETLVAVADPTQAGKLKLAEKECHFKGARRCIYTLESAREAA